MARTMKHKLIRIFVLQVILVTLCAKPSDAININDFYIVKRKIETTCKDTKLLANRMRPQLKDPGYDILFAGSEDSVMMPSTSLHMSMPRSLRLSQNLLEQRAADVMCRHLESEFQVK